MTNFCGGVEFEPQSVEAPKGASSCSGGSRFSALNDEGRNWPRANIGSSVTIQWRLTAAHRTGTWQYYVDGRLHQTFDQGGVQPSPSISHGLRGLPGGRHKILAIWNIFFDTPMAFYNCIDVQVGGGGNPPPPNPPPPGNPPPPPGGGCGTAWTRAGIYTGGTFVGHAGSKWRAKWWTQGEEPGTTGQWGVWEGPTGRLNTSSPCGARR